jgi:hypothetical protein
LTTPNTPRLSNVKRIIDSYPEHEREVRTKGIPSLGDGMVFAILASGSSPVHDPRQLTPHQQPGFRMASSIRRAASRVEQLS